MPAQNTWPLQPDPTPAATPSPLQPTAGALGVTVKPLRRRGLLRPFARDGKSDLANGTGDNLLESKIGQILGVNSEMPWRVEMKGNLDRLRQLNNGPALDEFARVYVSDALARWLPSVRVLAVTATRADNEMNLEIDFERTDVRTVQAPQSTSVVVPVNG